MSDTQKQVLCHKDLGLGLTHTNLKQRVRFPTIAKRAIAAKIATETISEELRVLYVAMTRAKDRLIMTYAATKLQDKLMDIALRLDMSARDLMTAYVNCPGSWILLTALQRTEAGEFFNLSDKPDCSCARDNPWNIHVVQAGKVITSTSEVRDDHDLIPQEVLEKISRGLSFAYSYLPATTIPSKLTATQLKGRVKDLEAAEFAGTPQGQKFDFRQPIRKHTKQSGTEFGNAMHSVMQYLDFHCCSSLTDIQRDVNRMVQAKLLKKEQAEIVAIDKIYRFFQTELGSRLATGKDILREFKFSILEDASRYFDEVSGDSILLQGVIDCALIEENGITVLDFKTDFVTDTNLQEKVALYKDQVQTYARALSRIFEKPVIASYIYFFSSEQFVQID